jgi:predicted peroxiredoxin
MKKILYLFVALALFAGCDDDDHDCDHDTKSEKHITVKDGMFIHVSSDDPHRVLMALKMAELISEDHDVLMYFDIKGVEVVVNNAPDFSYAQFPSSHAQIQKLLDSGIIIQACPGCLEAAGYTKDDLMPGIVLADKERFFNFTKGRILTMDY